MGGPTRRRFLQGIACSSLALAGCAEAGGVADVENAPPFDGWLSDTGNYDGVVDETGVSTVTVLVGGGDGLSFEPAAVRVDIGTVVRWEWAVGGTAHNVAAADDSFESEYHTEAGTTFERTFDVAGVVKYLCVPHEYAGMKGVVVIE